MSKQEQKSSAAHNQSQHKKRTTTSQTSTPQATQPNLSTAFIEAPLTTQSTMLAEMPRALQRTALTQVGQTQGNQYVQRLLQSSQSPNLQRREDGGGDESAAAMISTQDIQYEILAHHLAYQDSFDGPINDVLRQWGYMPQWAAVIDDVSTGFFVGLIMPDEAHPDVVPVLAFRGTEPTADTFADITADLHPGSVGANQFFTNEHIVEQFIDDAGGTVNVVGHSLGGALAQHAAAAFPSHIKRVVTFQAPGISREEAADFQAAQNKPDVVQHIAGGDIVDTAGEAHLEGDFFRHTPGGGPTSHLKFLLLSSELKDKREALGLTDAVLAELGIETEENKKPIEYSEDYPHPIKNALAESGRQEIGTILYPILNGINLLTRDDDALLRTAVQTLSLTDLALKTTGERAYIVDRLCRGLTGNEDEAAILRVLHASQIAGDVVQVLHVVNAWVVCENVHGGEYEALHTFLQAYYYPYVDGTDAFALIQQCVDGGLSEWQEEMIADILVLNPSGRALIALIGDVYGDGGFDEGLNQVEWWLDGADQKRVAAVFGSTGRWF